MITSRKGSRLEERYSSRQEEVISSSRRSSRATRFIDEVIQSRTASPKLESSLSLREDEIKKSVTDLEVQDQGEQNVVSHSRRSSKARLNKEARQIDQKLSESRPSSQIEENMAQLDVLRRFTVSIDQEGEKVSSSRRSSKARQLDEIKEPGQIVMSTEKPDIEQKSEEKG